MNDYTLGEALHKKDGLLTQLNKMFTGRKAEKCLDAFGRFLRKENDPWGDHSSEIYRFVGETTVVARNPFIARDHFVINDTPSAPVKIGFMNEDFKTCILPVIEEYDVCDAHLGAYELRGASKRLPATSVLVDIGFRYGTHLGHIWEILRKQRKGEEGLLKTERTPNIFYVYGVDGHLWVVCIEFYHHNSGMNINPDIRTWGIYASPLEGSISRYSRIFSIMK